MHEWPQLERVPDEKDARLFDFKAEAERWRWAHEDGRHQRTECLRHQRLPRLVNNDVRHAPVRLIATVSIAGGASRPSPRKERRATTGGDNNRALGGQSGLNGRVLVEGSANAAMATVRL